MRVSLILLLAISLMGTSPPVRGQDPDPAKIEDAPKVFLRFFKLDQKDKERTSAITKILEKRQKSLNKKIKKLSEAEKEEHDELKRDVEIWKAGYNVYKMTDKEKTLAFKVLFKKK